MSSTGITKRATKWCSASACLMVLACGQRESPEESCRASLAVTASGLVAAYGFDESSGETIVDATQTGRDAAISNQTRVPGRYGGALRFGSERIAVPNSGDLNLSTAMTLSAWVLPESAGPAWETIVYKGDDSIYSYLLYANTDLGIPGLWLGSTLDLDLRVGSALACSRWSHVAATYDGEHVRSYVNGNLVSTVVANGSLDANAGPLQIGGNAKWGEYLFGRIDEVRVYDRALSEAEIEADMATPLNSGATADTTAPTVSLTAPISGTISAENTMLAAEASDSGEPVSVDFLIDGQPIGAPVVAPPFTKNWHVASTSAGTHSLQARATDATGNVQLSSPSTVIVPAGLGVAGLVAAYSFDEPSGDMVSDVTHAGHDTVIAGQNRVVGRYGGALEFDGNLLRIAESDLLDLAPGMTLSAWVLPRANEMSFTPLVVKQQWGGSGVYRLVGNSGWDRMPESAVLVGGNWFSFKGGTQLSGQHWSHLAATYDGSSLSLYVNGVLVGAQAVSGAIDASSEPLFVGGHDGWGEYFRGRLDEIRIYNRALSATEIQADMATPLTAGATADQTPPAVSVTVPAADSTVSGLVTLEAAASDPGDAVSVQFYVDGVALSTPVTQPPYRKSWHAGSIAAGNHVITAEATDPAGNVVTSAPVTVTIAPGTSVVGLVAAYGFDEGSGDAVIDATGAGHDGVLSNGQTRVAGRYGGALEFNGSQLLLAETELLRLSTGMTLSAWVLPKAGGSSVSPIVMQGGDGGLHYRMSLYNKEDGKIAVMSQFANTTGDWRQVWADETLVPVTAWTHVSATYDGENYRVYVNGELAGSASVVDTIYHNVGQLRIGGFPNWGDYFRGRIDEVRVYNRALSAAEIKADMSKPVTAGATAPAPAWTATVSTPPNDGTITGSVTLTANVSANDGPVTVQFLVDGVALGAPVTAAPYEKSWHAGSATAGDHTIQVEVTDAWGNKTLTTSTILTVEPGHSVPGLIAAYGFDEPSGEAVHDVTRAGHDTVLAGQNRVVGRYGGALEFNGNLLTVADSELLDLTTGMTLSAWVLPRAEEIDCTPILIKQHEGGAAYKLSANQNWPRQPEAGFGTNGGWFRVTGGIQLSSQHWSNLAVTYDGGLLSLYIDGVMVGSEAVSGAIDVTSDPLLIGGHDGWGEYFRGRLDEIRIYNRALSVAEVQADMATPLTAGATADETPPAVSITAPAADSAVSGLVMLEAAASDPGGAVSVQFYVDGVALSAPVTQPPYRKPWHAASAAIGSHVITAAATDPAGNVAMSAPVTVSIAAGTSVVGLVAAYGFDEGSGDAVIDATGAGHNGVLSNGQTRVAGRYGGALEYNGSQLLLAETELLRLSTGMTLSAWVLPKAGVPGVSPIVMKGGDWDLHYRMSLYNDEHGKIALMSQFVNTARDWQQVWADGVPIPVTAWTHVSATYDGENYRVFVNGELAGTTSVVANIYSEVGPLRIGGFPNWGDYFRGRIDEVRVYNRALSAAEIKADMSKPVTAGATAPAPAWTATVSTPPNDGTITGSVTLTANVSANDGPVTVQFLVDGVALGAPVTAAPYEKSWHAGSATTGDHTIQVEVTDAWGNKTLTTSTILTVEPGHSVPGLIAAYSFDEASGEAASDVTRAGHDTVLAGQQRVVGRYGNALEFDGNVLRVADSELLDLTTGMTLSAWVLPRAGETGFTPVVVKQQWEWSAVYQLIANTDWDRVPEGAVIANGNWHNVRQGAELSSQHWSYLAVTYDGGLLNLYIDGVMVGSEAVSGAIDITSDPLLIGGHDGWGEYFRGRLDEIRVYNRALSATEIQADMATPLTAGATADETPPAVSVTSPVADSTVSGLVTLEAAASDPGGAVSVQFYVDGVALSSPVTQPPFRKPWHAASAATGSHVITAAATDPAGNAATSAPVTVTIAPGASIAGLVAAYGFDEGNGSAVLDATGAGHDGVLSSGQTRVAGRYGGALEFTDSQLLLAETELLRLSTGMTLSAWVLPKAGVPGVSPIVMKGSDWDLHYRISLYNGADGRIVPMSQFVNTARDWQQVWADGAPIPVTAWTHVSATYDGESYRVYVNGELARTTELAASIYQSAGPLRIGGFPNWGEYFRGRIDEVRVYNRALTASEIVADMAAPVTPGALPDTSAPTVNLTAPIEASTANTKTVTLAADANDASGFVAVRFLVDGKAIGPDDTAAPYERNWHAASEVAGTHLLQAEATDAHGNKATSAAVSVTVPPGLGIPGLVAAYAFDEEQSVLVRDVTGAGHDTQLSGQSRIAGKFGGALVFSGNKLNVADSTLLDLTRAMTISAWVMPDAALADWSTVLMKETNDGDFAYVLYASNPSGNPNTWIFAENGWHGIEGSTPLPAQAWSHVAATYDGDTLVVYHDGVAVQSMSVGYPIKPSNGDLTIGGNDVWGEFFNGRIDEVRIYNRALSVAEIQAHMATPLSSGTGPDTILPIVNLTAPTSGSTLSGLVTLQAIASDDVGVQQVEFFVDDVLLGNAISLPPYQTTWLASVPGVHTLRAQATDTSGNVGTSSVITITVVAGCDPATISDGNPCTIDSCGTDGLPVFSPVAAGTPCSNGNRCDGLESCNNVGQCLAGVAPTVDTSCDGIDDDCDGLVDEDYVVQANTCGVGACQRSGTVVCLGGVTTVQCSPGVAAPDDAVCNGTDDDCDGQVDEDYVVQNTTCGSGSCQGHGTTACIGGAVRDSCTAGSGAASDTICNGIDDDCDGQVDEDFVATTVTCGLGVCSRSGNVVCEAGALVTQCTPGIGAPSDVTCDGLDDDCDGTTDEDYRPRSTSCGTGACAATGTTNCASGAEIALCQPGTPAPADPTCNGIDDDCDGQADEDYALVATSCGVGACAASGATSCAGGVVQNSCAARPAAANDATCNGVDDDCDGIADEDYAEVATTCGVGACTATGARRCVLGHVTDSCVPGTAAPTDATCNGVDDDCDGRQDEDYVGTPTQCGAGACLATGSLSCVNGQVVDSCAAGSASSNDQVCDGIDSNCNGQVDEGYQPHATSCGVGVCHATGTSTCVLGVEQGNCQPGLPTGSDTNCDGQDDDCDGQIDESYVPVATQCGVGACAASGQRTCVAGHESDSCAALQPATSDANCNGIDDDCDGQADEDYVAQSTSCGVGACQRSGSIECHQGALRTVCTAGTGAGSDTTCNGIDDDCDGQVDEDYLPQSTSCGTGACQRGGTIECQNGAPLTVCTAGTGSAIDTTCNGVDDDCDGGVDEDYVPQTTSCGTGACQAQGTTSCVAGAVHNSCTAGTGAGSDTTCNGIDDDCDGNTDEDYLAQATSCGVGVCQRTGVTSCAGGQVHNSCQPGSAAGSDSNCDGLDDDCDGTADEDYAPRTVTCGTGACMATATTACVQGTEQSQCQALTPAPNDAQCNGIDDDCDGQIDEDYVVTNSNCGVGACSRSGQVTCVGGAPADSCRPATPSADDRTCDGIDEDCDGQADEDYAPVATTCGVGACVSEGQRNCAAGHLVDNCQPRAAASNDATCNGQDDDCDGNTDEDFVGSQTTCGVGACIAHGTESCSGGHVANSCTPQQPGGNDANCDGVDNDCDGSVDEEYVPVQTSCGVGACAATGTTTCSGGHVTQNCHPGSASGSDNDCNGIDDDCDGAVDEAFVPRCAGTAVEHCVGGAIQRQECVDSNPCNGTESCGAGACHAGSAISVSDGNPCTSDSCDPARGIQHQPAAAGTACGTQQACDGQGNCIAKPQITAQPQAVTVAPGQTAVFTVAASGDSLQYQWRRLGQDIAGATANVYTKSNVTLADQGAEYSVVVSNAAGSAVGGPAILTVADTVGPTLFVAGDASRSVSSDIVTLTGTAVDNGVAASSVGVQSNRWQGEVAGIISSGTGAFTVEVPLNAGTNQLTVIARDAQGNTTQQAIVVTLTVASLPTIAITSPTAGARITTDTVDVRGVVRSTLSPNQIRLVLGGVVQFPVGADGEYTFLFSGVRLTPGTNALTVRAETTEGAVTAQVIVTRGDTTSETGNPPLIRVAGAQSDLFVTSSTLSVSGTVTADRCVSDVTVNGIAATIIGAGASVSFERTLLLTGSNAAQAVTVQAHDCDGRAASLAYNVTYDDQSPQISLGLSPAPDVHTVSATPFLLAGTITEPNLAGFTIGQQSIGLLPGTNGSWDFNASIPLTRAVDTPLELVAWDRSGNRSTYSLLVRLDVPFEIEVIAPRADETYSSLEAQVAVSVVARVVGLPESQVVTAHVDGSAPYRLSRAGETFTGSFSVPTDGAAHLMAVEVRDTSGGILLSKSVPFTVKSANDIPLEAKLQDPLNESQNLETNQVIGVSFSRPIDPTKFSLEVRETVQGKQYKKPKSGAGLGQFNSVALEDVVRNNEVVPGGLSILPGDTFAAFYPAREFAYEARIVLTGTYDGREVVRGSFAIRPLPTLMAGFVTDHFSNVLEGIEVSISGPVSKTTVTNQYGAFSFGYGDYSAAIPGGRYQLVINPSLKDRRYGVTMQNVDAQQGRYKELGVMRTPLLSATEPFRLVTSGVPNVILAGGAMKLDLSQAMLEFPDRQPSGEVHTQLLWGPSVGYPGLEAAPAMFTYAMQPMGIAVSGSVGLDFEVPAPLNGNDVLTTFHERLLISALDAASLQLIPVGVAKIDPTTRRAHTERPIAIGRLDFIAVTPMPDTRAQSLLASFAAGQIDRNQLTMSFVALH